MAAEQNSTVCGRGGIDNLPRTIVYVLYTAQRFFIDLLILLFGGRLIQIMYLAYVTMQHFY